MMTINEIQACDVEFRAAIGRIRANLSLSAATDMFETLLNEWDRANALGDPIGLAGKIDEFLGHMMLRLHRSFFQNSCTERSEDPDSDLIRSVLQGDRSDADIAADGWDAVDARAEIDGMLEMLHRFSFPENLRPDLSDPRVAWLQEHTDMEQFEYMKPYDFVYDLDLFLGQVLDTRRLFKVERAAN